MLTIFIWFFSLFYYFSLIRFGRLCVLPAGLPPPLATLRHTNLGSLAGALCVRTMRFLHLTARLPYQGLFPVRLSHDVK